MPHRQDETKQVQRVGFYSFLVNLALTCLKAMLACLSGSLPVVASAVDSAADSAASLALWAGLKLSTRKSERFPYGLYKIENVIQVFVAFLIFLMGYEIVREIISAPAGTPNVTLTVVIGMGISVLIPWVFGWYTMWIGRRTGSPALIADGRHRQADVLSTAVVLAAVAAHYSGLHINYHGITVDRIAAGLVVIFIAFAGLELLVNGMRVLLDVSIDPATLDEVRRLIESQPAVAEVRFLVGRSAGRFRFLEGALVLRVEDLEKAHAINERIEAGIRKKVPNIDRILIHYEPQAKFSLTIAIPMESDGEIISRHFGEAHLFYIASLRNKDFRVLEERFIANPYREKEKGKGIAVGHWLIDLGVDRLYTPRSLEGKGPAYVLSNAGVETELLRAHTLAEFWKEKGRAFDH